MGSQSLPCWIQKRDRKIAARFFLAASPQSIMLRVYCLTNDNETNPLDIEIWYRKTRDFLILDGMKAIWSMPKKYRTLFPALLADWK